MEWIASATGGRHFGNPNDILKGIEQTFEDTRQFYLLGYVSSNDTHEGLYRKIVVRVNRPQVKVLAKAGYWAPK